MIISDNASAKLAREGPAVEEEEAASPASASDPASGGFVGVASAEVAVVVVVVVVDSAPSPLERCSVGEMFSVASISAMISSEASIVSVVTTVSVVSTTVVVVDPLSVEVVEMTISGASTDIGISASSVDEDVETLPVAALSNLAIRRLASTMMVRARLRRSVTGHRGRLAPPSRDEARLM